MAESDLFKGISWDHIFKALGIINEEGYPPERRSTSYDLVYNKITYPPKYVLSLAGHVRDGKFIDHNHFSGGERSEAFKYLRNHGFSVVPKAETRELEKSRENPEVVGKYLKKPEQDPIQQIIERYKTNVRETRLKDEIYKWILLGEFQGRPRTEAKDFGNEITSIKFKNLLYPMVFAVSKHILKTASEPYRQCFQLLFNEAKPLIERIEEFDQQIMTIYRGVGGKHSHHHDERSIATFLTYHDPGRYTFYKDGFYRKYCEQLGIEPKKKGSKYVHYLELVKDLISDYINKDKELISMVDELIPPGAYRDPSHTLLAQDILYTTFAKGIEEIEIGDARVFKISMGSLPLKELNNCVSRSLIVVHKDTRGKGTTKETQAEAFVKSMGVGDYFYLTHGNNEGGMKLFGRITSDSTESSERFANHTGWLQRTFESIVDPVSDSKYEGPSKWWAPNNNSTCIEIEPDELSEANKLIFEPYFRTRLVSNNRSVVADPESTYVENISGMKMPLNQILYGPPGTGKTYELINTYYPMFTSAPEEISEQEKLTSLVLKYTWWQVVAAIVLDLKTARVTDILNHRLLQIKDSVSSQKNARAMIWAMLQQHTKQECEHVKYALRNEPLFFDKDSQGNWTIDTTIVEAEAPEVTELLAASKAPAQRGTNEIIKRYEFVTFHQSFSYEDFVEGIKPIMEEDAEVVRYSIEEGIFKRICARARRDPDNNYALFIDEINRGNISQIFGELITLIEDDKRENAANAIEVELPYSKTKFSVPSNIHIIGTMNTADRSVEALDTALRRRFSFKEMMPSPDLIRSHGKSRDQNGIIEGVDLAELLTCINTRIEKLLDKDHLIGHSYFMDVDSLDSLKAAFQNKINPLLQEYFYGDIGKVGLVLGSAFFEDNSINKKETLFADFPDYETSELLERRVHRLKNVLEMTSEEFQGALTRLLRK